MKQVNANKNLKSIREKQENGSWQERIIDYSLLLLKAMHCLAKFMVNTNLSYTEPHFWRILY